MLAETEHKRIVGIPPVRRLSVVRIEPLLVGIPVEIEDVRVAVGIGNVCRAIYITAPANWRKAEFYMRSRIALARQTKILLFYDTAHILRKKHMAVYALNVYGSERS
ncbi:MAG: hypothetical protein UW94_C0002G0079 [Parcubacteria group bacterium GW2011_GWA2_45_14]|nr:MAG: hypothetical protein UW94_C0002G0079 [Parcubacteria group bacterium GW2011_GWA2_45_14]